MARQQASTATTTWDTRTLVTLALLAAIGALLSFVEGGNFGGFLKYDASFVPAMIGGFIFGAVPGFVVGAITVVIHALVSGNFWGGVMNLCGIAAYVIPAALIYRSNPTRTRAVVALVVSSILCIIVMILMNLVVTPIYTGMPVSAIVGMIVPLLLPFNVFKAVVNSVVTFLLYKTVSNMVKPAKKKA